MAGALNLILALSWLPLVYAQSGAVHTVDVGEHGLTFDPDTLTVSPGSKVEFHFYPSSHSVAQAAFSKPCHPLNESSFYSGTIPATDGESVSPAAKSLGKAAILIVHFQSPRSSH
jgi:plastocyanin